MVIKNSIAPSNLISVVSKGDRLLSKNTIRDKSAPETAHKTDKKENIYFPILFSLVTMFKLLTMRLVLCLSKMKSDIDIMTIPI